MNKGQPYDIACRRGRKDLDTVGGFTGCPPEHWFAQWPGQAEEFLARHHRPLVTVSYAQSVDGSIATRAPAASAERPEPPAGSPSQ